jgi:hypothetical protein
MSERPGTDRSALDKSLQQLDSLIGELDAVDDPRVRQSTRQAIELLLDLHGLALARLIAIIAAAENGPALSEILVADPHVCAILLLHGLHPQDARQRIRQTLSRMQAQWQSRGFRVDLVDAKASSARVRLYHRRDGEDLHRLRSEVEAALTDVAPDLDEIFIEIEEMVIEPEEAVLSEAAAIAL